MILEYATEGEVYKELRNQPNHRFEDAKSADYIYQVAQALKYLHSKKVIHRDIKPENLLNCQGTIKLSDFGWSTHSPDDRRKTMCGTLDYLPPEMVNTQKYDHSVDIWSIGILAYELLTGNPPFEADSQQKTFDNINLGKVFFPEYVSDEAKDFITMILKHTAVERPSMEQIEAHPWLRNQGANK